MTSGRNDLAAELVAERVWSSDRVWAAAEARLDRPLAEGLNTAHEACDRWARDRARLAMVVRHPDGRSERWTFAELAEASSRLATAFAAAGLRRGDRVAGVLGQQIEAYVAALAAWRAGLVYMPLFAGFGAAALAQRLNDAEPRVVVVDSAYREGLEAARALLTGDPAIVTVTDARGRGLRAGDHSFWSEVERHSADTAVVATAPSETSTLIYTSGTTGDPKGCLKPHSLVLAIQPFVRHTYALEPSDMFFSGAGPGWAFGLSTTGTAIMAQGLPRVVYSGSFSGPDWLTVWAEERVTYAAAAPSAFRMLGKALERDARPLGLRGASSAGEPLDAPLMQAWRALGAGELQDSYGQSEIGMCLANLAHSEVPIVPGKLASVVPGFDVDLVDEEGNPQSEQGIIALRAPRYLASTGYWRLQEKWDARWRGEWFLSGDVARRDELGRFEFVGRNDDLIVTSGYNVGPSEVENIVLGLPGVREAGVVAAPDPVRGAVVRAVVVADGTVPEEQLAENIRAAVREQLGRHAYPRVVDFVDSLPRTETGKVRRTALRGQLHQSS